MKTISKYIISLFLAIFIFGIIPTANASTALFPKPIEDFHKDGPINSYLVTTNNGYMRVYYDENSKKVGIEYYDSNFNITSTKSIAMELSLWGGFYKGKDAYYLIEGQDNLNEVYGAEYMRVIKYDFNWNKKGTAKVTTALPDTSTPSVGEPPSNHTSSPFQSNVSITEYNNTLYIATGRLGYRDSKGWRHQGLLLVAVDESTMECHIVDENLYHSNDQYLVNDGADIYMIDSRTDKYLYLSVYDSNMYSGDTYSDRSERTKSKGSILDFKFADSFDTIFGMELSDNNVLTVLESSDQDASNIEHAFEDYENVYLTVTPKSNMTKEATTIKKLTDYTKQTHIAALHLTKINSNRFLVMWGETSTTIPKATDSNDTLSGYTLHYIFVDGNGNKLTQEYTVNARVSECPPILNGSKVVFSSSSELTFNFYTIDANSGAFSKKVYRKLGDNVTWSVDSNGTMTVSGTGKVEADSENSEMNTLRGLVNCIKIDEGITDIDKNVFYPLGDVEKVYLPNSVKSIGKDAFDTNDDLSVALGFAPQIFYCNSGSYAQKYCEQNDIRYELLDSTQQSQSSSSSKTTSSSVKPQSSSNKNSSSSKSSSKPSSSSAKPQSSSSSSSSVPASSSVTESSTVTSSSSTGNTSTSSSSVSSSSSSVSTSSSSSATSSVPAESASSSNGSSGNSSSSSSVSSTVNAENTSDNGLRIIIAVAGGAVVVAGVIIAVVVAKKKR